MGVRIIKQNKNLKPFNIVGDYGDIQMNALGVWPLRQAYDMHADLFSLEKKKKNPHTYTHMHICKSNTKINHVIQS